jgi:hypothetical protein
VPGIGYSLNDILGNEISNICKMSSRSKISSFGIADGISGTLIDESRRIFWTAKDMDNVLFDGKNISNKDEAHWNGAVCRNLHDCEICCVLLPASKGWFSDHRIYPMVSISHTLYEKLRKFRPYKTHAHIAKDVTCGAPSRLLDVFTGEIICDTDGKAYFTVSHVWSSNNFGAPFSKNNKGYPWLKRMAKLLKLTYAWIDTYCIDQTDIKDKQREIGKMRDYYRNANSCAVLLDFTDTKDIDTFVANMRLLGVKALDNPYRRLGHIWALASIFYSNLLTDLWFKRIWTIQEIILSRSVVVDSSCGLVNLVELLKYYHIIVEIFGKMAMCGGDMDQTRTLSQYLYMITIDSVDSIIGDRLILTGHNLGSVLELCMGREATNQHDYVYGILGLLPNVSITVDYSLGLEDVTVSLFRESTRNGDLSWISWIGPFSLKNYSYIPIIGLSISVDKWESDLLNKISATFDEDMVILSEKMRVKIVGTARWEGAYPGVADNCNVLSALCSEEKLCESCLVLRFCNNGCCMQNEIWSTFLEASVNHNFCDKCVIYVDDGREYDECQPHIVKLFAKQPDFVVVLMKTQDNKYLVGRIDISVFPHKHVKVLMFGSPKTGYRGWIMDKGNRIGVVTSHEKSFVPYTKLDFRNFMRCVLCI